MKTAFLSICLFLVTFAATAQNLVGSYTALLRTPDPATGATVSVINSPGINSQLQVTPKSEKISGFRICILSDNTQNARGNASSALNTFTSRFPGIPAEIIYQSPYFKVMVGRCLNRTEATMLLGQIGDLFPAANISSGSFTIDQLLTVQTAAADSTAVLTEDIQEPIL